jgi:hypothetical protein
MRIGRPLGAAADLEESLRRITKGLSVLAATVLAAGITAGQASAATQQHVNTKAQWQAAIAQVPTHGSGCFRASYPSLRWTAATCVAAPKIPFAPAQARGTAGHAGPATVGNGTDFSAVVTGKITTATGTFTHVSSGITEKGQVGGSGSLKANIFSLQINSQFFSGSPACNGSSNPSNCLAWQQFVYAANGNGTGDVFIQYWLINFSATCPSGWFTFSSDCFTNSAASSVTAVTAKQLATLKLVGTAASGGSDSVALSIGSGSATKVTGKDSKITLAPNWNTTEWGVYGDGGGSGATFGAGTSLEAQTALKATSSGAPKCVKEGFTGETNNLKLAATPVLGSEPSPTIGSKQTNGTTGTASCATKA